MYKRLLNLFYNLKQKRLKRERGQNLVELVLTLPFLILIIFGIVEMGRVWQTYQGAKMAAVDGAYTASVFQDEVLGETQIQSRLDQAGITYTAYDIVPIKNTSGNNVTVGYKASVTAEFRPVFGGFKLPTLSTPIAIIPAVFLIQYDEIYYPSIY